MGRWERIEFSNGSVGWQDDKGTLWDRDRKCYWDPRQNRWQRENKAGGWKYGWGLLAVGILVLLTAPSVSGWVPAKQVKAVEKPGYQISCTYPVDILKWDELIVQAADETGINPDLIAAVMVQESGGDPTAYSHSGAVGLMQVMPRDGLAESFMCANGPCFAGRPTIAELEDPEFNTRYGSRMLAGLIKRYGNERDALMAYGPKDVGYYYADKVLAIYENYGANQSCP